MTDTVIAAPLDPPTPVVRKDVRRRKIGVAPFLNAQPLIYGLAPYHDLPALAPNAMAKALKEGSLDVALAPVVASFLNPELPIIPVAAVGSKGAVRTVRILSNGAPQGIKRLFVDDRSQTSVLQSRLTLKKWFGVKDLEVTPVVMGAFKPGQTKPWEAVLQFGDNALVSAPTGMTVTDLGEEWLRYTGKPFVNAVWLARDAQTAEEMKDQLAEAKAEGLKHLDEILAGYHGIWQFKHADAKSYLETNIRYDYGEEEQAGQAEFRKLLKEEGLLE
ncbi:MAG TPA: MqnA/MqnD/SBP family protein [bacterium]|nr:MqnA/MqnD/SBP family protein [bacterium]